VYAVDLHTHTRFFHGVRARPTPFDPVGARLLAASAAGRGLDGVATTNHDYDFRPDVDIVTHIPGNEVTTTRGHLLVVGPDPPETTIPGELTPPEVVDLARERDCATVLAHPMRNSSVQQTTAEFDAVELNGKHPDTHDSDRALAANRDLPLVGGSDAHFPFEAGRAYTRVDAPELTPEAVVAAIRDGRVEPVVAGGPLHAALETAYGAVHRLRGHR
jgi:predicted metal-dependent phosphoesterase TrpH